MILSMLGAGEGPVLLSNVNCNDNNTILSQCVHPEDIGFQNCDADNTAGVLCSENITLEMTTASSPSMISLPAVIGGVVGALAMLIAAIIIVVVLIVLVARRRIENKGKGPGKKTDLPNVLQCTYYAMYCT